MHASRLGARRPAFWPIVVRVVAVLFLAASLAVLLSPLGGIEEDTGQLDKFVHALLFFGVSTSLAFLFRSLIAPILVGLAVSLGAILEVSQGFVGRDPSWGDFLANVAGIAVFLMLALFLRRRPANKRRYGRSATWLP